MYLIVFTCPKHCPYALRFAHGISGRVLCHQSFAQEECQESWRGGEVAPYNGLYVEAPTERHTFCRLKPKRVGISLIEVYERVGKAVRSVKGPKRADRRILWLWGRQENFLV